MEDSSGMDVAATFTTRRGAAADRFFRAVSAEDEGRPKDRTSSVDSSDDDLQGRRGKDSDHEADEPPASATSNHTHNNYDDDDVDDNGQDCFVPTNAVEQVLHDPYLLLKIFRWLFGPSMTSPPPSLPSSIGAMDHLRPAHRRLASVRRVCTLWRAIARIVCPPVDYLRARPSCHMLTNGTGTDALTDVHSSLLSLAMIPLPAMAFPSSSSSSSPSPARSSSSSSSSQPPLPSTPPPSSATGIKLYLVSGYSEGEVKIWDLDGRGPDGSHCVKTLQYTSPRWFSRHFRSMALASLVEPQLPTYTAEEEREELELEAARRRQRSNRSSKRDLTESGGGLMARLGSASPFSLMRSSTSTSTSTSTTGTGQSHSLSVSAALPSRSADAVDSLLLQRSVDDLSTVRQTRKKSWLAKKWERSKQSGRQSSSPASAPSSPQPTLDVASLTTTTTTTSPSGESSPTQASPPPSPTGRDQQNLPLCDRGYTSAPVISRRHRYSLYRERIMAQENIEVFETTTTSQAEEKPETSASEEPNTGSSASNTKNDDESDAPARDIELTSIPWPLSSNSTSREEEASTRGRKGHLASVYYHLILIWDVVQGVCLRALEGHSLEVNALQPLKGGRQLASGSEDKSIRIWDVTTGQCLRVLQRRMGMYRSPVLSLTALPNGHLVAGAENNKITVWDVDTGKRVNTLKGATEPVWHFQMMYDKQGLYADASDSRNVMRLVSSTGHWDPERRTNKGQVAVWDVKNAKKLRTVFEYDGYARNMMGLPGGYLAVAFHYYGSSNINARLVILDLNAIAATAPSAQSQPGSPSSSTSPSPALRRRTTRSASEAGERPKIGTPTLLLPSPASAPRIWQRRPQSPTSGLSQSRESDDVNRSRSSSEGDASGDEDTGQPPLLIARRGGSSDWLAGYDGSSDGDLHRHSRANGGGEDDGGASRQQQESNADGDGEKEKTKTGEAKEEGKEEETVEEGDGSTWRLMPGTKDLKINSMVVLPDGRLIGAASDGCIWIWSFDTKSR